MRKVKKIIKQFLILFICLFISRMDVSALQENNLDFKIKMCELSDEYIKWEKLSDEEKKNTVMPPMCDLSSYDTKVSPFSLYSLKLNSNNLPTSYDGRKQDFATSVRDQLTTGSCWAFSSLSGLEYLVNKQYDTKVMFSPRHMEYLNTRILANGEINEYGYNREINTGGNFFSASNYFINGNGPVLEEDMPFATTFPALTLNEVTNKKVQYDINNIIIEYDNNYRTACTTDEIDKIKQYVYEYGAVAISTYMTESASYYNSKTAGFYYNGYASSNHAVVIVGWDDEYEKENFSSSNRPKNDGAWIVQNSYGTNFGDSGYYYISYEDLRICDIYMVITSVDKEVEDNSYVYDKLGYTGFIGLQSYDGTTQYKTAYAMNVFEKEVGKNEVLKEITFGNYGTGEYEVFYVEGNGSNITTANMMKVGSGDLKYSGYITHKLDNPIFIDEEVTEFSIVVHYMMDDSYVPLAVSYNAATGYQYISLESEQGYISYDGTIWDDILEASDELFILSLKGFSDDVNYSMKIGNSNVAVSGNNYVIDIDYIQENINLEDLSLVLKDTNNNEISGLTTTFNDNSMQTIMSKEISTGAYYASVYYNNVYIGEKRIVLGETDENTITSDVYTVNQDDLIIYVNPETTLNEFISNVEGVTATYTSPNIDYVYTGLKVDNYTIVVLGDVTGDGHTKMNDVMKICVYIVEGKGLFGYAKLAADVNMDTNIKMNDAMKISTYIVEGSSL